MYQDITETMLGLLGNIFQSIYFCFDNYQVYPYPYNIHLFEVYRGTYR